MDFGILVSFRTGLLFPGLIDQGPGLASPMNFRVPPKVTSDSDPQLRKYLLGGK